MKIETLNEVEWLIETLKSLLREPLIRSMRVGLIEFANSKLSHVV
jgi:hypothetical protein